MGPQATNLAALFYGSLVVVAALWNGLRGREFRFFEGSALEAAALGFAAAGLTVSLGLLVYRLVPVMRRLSDEIAPQMVDGVPFANLLLLSLFSGVGEEVFFRGAVQPEFGLLAASLLFGLAHIGPDRRYLVWTLWAVLAGFLFGSLYEFTGGLLAPVIAHVLHNATVFGLWKRSRARLKNDEVTGDGDRHH
ncbi:MAG: CPBP family intramembrane metalloprotease [Rubrobacter sp.]|nr:CPBP family intramembrane metalloprotease [Rubrobacter sp.]